MILNSYKIHIFLISLVYFKRKYQIKLILKIRELNRI